MEIGHLVLKLDAKERDLMNGKQHIKNHSHKSSHPVNSQTIQQFNHTEWNGIGKCKGNHDIKWNSDINITFLVCF